MPGAMAAAQRSSVIIEIGGLVGNILFFARDPEFVKLVFDAAFDFAGRVLVGRLTFAPDARVWELIP
jgi:hypothetical protein